MKSHLFSKAAALAVLVAAVLVVGNIGKAQPDDADEWCPGCRATTNPSAIEPVTLPTHNCSIRFNFIGVSGSCQREMGNPEAPCLEKDPCEFRITPICMGPDCAQWVQGLYSLDGAVIPVLIPCGTTLSLGRTGCGTEHWATVVAYNVSSGETQLGTSHLVCKKCVN